MKIDKPPIPFDFWHFARDGRSALALGISTPGDVAHFLGLRPKAVRLQPRPLDRWPGAEIGDLYFQFDMDERLQGVNYGFRHDDTLTEIVHWAIANPADDRAATTGAPPLAVNGRPILAAVTLQRFIAALGGTPPLHLSGRDSDKWLHLSITTDIAVFHADFLLKAVKIAYGTVFNIDYCLHGLSVMSTTASTPQT